MSHHYSDPKRESETYALPDIEVFYWKANTVCVSDDPNEYEPDNEAGWYYWSCFPGCMPDSDPFGPYDTEELALEAARDSAAD